MIFKSLHNRHLDMDREHYNQRSMVERVNKYLKDDFGYNKIYYQEANKETTAQPQRPIQS